MTRKKFLLMASCLTVLGLLLASCAPAAVPTAAPKAGAPPVATSTAISPSTAKPLEPAPTPKPGADAPRYGGTLTVALKTATPHFDMLQETGGMVQLPMATTYNLLIQHNPMENFKITGDLARSWEISSDGLAYTFLLNEGVKFHNGKVLTAEDVRFNIDRIINPPRGTLSPRKELYRNVQKMEASDSKTLKITLKEPQAAFLTLAALPYNYISDPDIIKQKGDMKRDVMGTGPFKMKDFVYSISFTAEKNPDYFIKGRPYLDKVVFYTITDEMTRSAAMRTGRVKILPLYGAVSTSLSLLMQKSEPSIVLQKRVTPGPNPLIPNLKVAPWNDVRVRQALHMAIDREAMSKAVRDFYPNYGYMIPGSPWALPTDEVMAIPGHRQPKDQDIAEAKRLLAEAGYPDGFETPLLSITTAQTREVAQVAVAQLAKIGIKVTIQFVEVAAWKELVFKGSFRLGAQADASAIDDPDIMLGEYYLTGSPKNYGGWSNPKFDELYALQSKTMDVAKRKEIVWEMQRLLFREMPRVGVLWSTLFAASWPEVRNWTQGNSLFLGNSLQDVWLAK
ncbi:MAG: ABC transporter substrate-binding protein [Chloroflexi bacterium]|nr:ABC transporter substrate-binding protein [Chloroflexota bacterium]